MCLPRIREGSEHFSGASRRAKLLLTLNPHDILDGIHTLDVACDFDGFFNIGFRTDEAAQLHDTLEGFDINFSGFQ